MVGREPETPSSGKRAATCHRHSGSCVKSIPKPPLICRSSQPGRESNPLHPGSGRLARVVLCEVVLSIRCVHFQGTIQRAPRYPFGGDKCSILNDQHRIHLKIRRLNALILLQSLRILGDLSGWWSYTGDGLTPPAVDQDWALARRKPRRALYCYRLYTV